MRGCLPQGLKWTGLTLAAVLSVVLLTPYLVPDRGGPRLQPPRRTIAPDDNGWELLMAAAATAEQLPRPAANYLPTPGRANLAGWVAAGAPALAKLDRAMAKPALAEPPSSVIDGLGAQPAMSGVRDLARLKCQRGLSRMAERQTGAGLEDLLGAWRLGRRFADADGPIISYLVGVACQTMALNSLSWSLAPLPYPPSWRPHEHPEFRSPPRLNAAQRRLWQRARDSLVAADGDAVRALRRALAREHDFFTLSVRELGAPQEGLPGWTRLAGVRTVFLDSRHAAGLQRRALRELQAALERPASPAPRPTVEALKAHPFRGYNPGGRILVGITTRAFEAAGRPTHTLTARQRAVAAMIGLRLYWDDHGRLPANWSALVAGGYLSAPPADPFTGKPLGYDPRRAVIWSVGPDGSDDVGRRTDTHADGPDIVFDITSAPSTE